MTDTTFSFGKHGGCHQACFTAGPAEAGRRLDQALHEWLPEYSRARLQEWIKAGNARVNGEVQKPRYALRAGDSIEVTPAALPSLNAVPEEIPLTVLYEDADVIAVDKPAGMVVHAGAGVHSGTLVNALLHRFESLSTLGGDQRPGIVHRLDRFTSGVLLVAKNDSAHRALAAQWASRDVEKVYLALVHGCLASDTGRISKPIARDPSRRIRMTSRLASGRAALSEYRVLRRFPAFTYLEVRIATGRTHQIRVHLASIGHPVAGDRLYGAPAAGHERFFLHAHRIRFRQPSTGDLVEVVSPLPPDLTVWLGTI